MTKYTARLTGVIFAAFFLMSCQQRERTDHSSSSMNEITAELEDELDEKVTTFSLSGYGEGGKRTWELTGKSADISDNQVKLEGIEGKGEFLWIEKERLNRPFRR